MSRVADSAGAEEVRRIDREIDDQAVTITVIEADDERAYPHWEDRSLPRWMESLLADFGVRGIRTGAHGGEI